MNGKRSLLPVAWVLEACLVGGMIPAGYGQIDFEPAVIYAAGSDAM